MVFLHIKKQYDEVPIFWDVLFLPIFACRKTLISKLWSADYFSKSFCSTHVHIYFFMILRHLSKFLSASKQEEILHIYGL